MEINRYRPNFVTGFPDENATVNSIEELLNVEWIASWKDYKHFHRFSYSDSYLMVEYDNNTLWYVIAILPDKLADWFLANIPKWIPP